MGGPTPWSIKGIDPEARRAAKAAAQREGLTLGAWITKRVIEADAAEADGEAQQGDPGRSAAPARAPVGRADAAPSAPSGAAAAGLEAAIVARMAPLLARIEAIGDDVEKLSKSVDTAGVRVEIADRAATLIAETIERQQAKQAAALETALQAAGATAASGDGRIDASGLDLDAVAQRAADIAAEKLQKDMTQTIAPIALRLDALTEGAADGVSTTERAITSLVERVEYAAARHEEMSTAVGGAVAALAQRLEDVEAALSGRPQEPAMDPLAEAMAFRASVTRPAAKPSAEAPGHDAPAHGQDAHQQADRRHGPLDHGAFRHDAAAHAARFQADGRDGALDEGQDDAQHEPDQPEPPREPVEPGPDGWPASAVDAEPASELDAPSAPRNDLAALRERLRAGALEEQKNSPELRDSLSSLRRMLPGALQETPGGAASDGDSDEKSDAARPATADADVAETPQTDGATALAPSQADAPSENDLDAEFKAAENSERRGDDELGALKEALASDDLFDVFEEDDQDRRRSDAETETELGRLASRLLSRTGGAEKADASTDAAADDDASDPTPADASSSSTAADGGSRADGPAPRLDRAERASATPIGVGSRADTLDEIDIWSDFDDAPPARPNRGAMLLTLGLGALIISVAIALVTGAVG